MVQLKSDHVKENSVTMSSLTSLMVSRSKDKLPFRHFFYHDIIAVPIPSTSLMRKDSLWVPLNLANAMMSSGLVKEVRTYLQRSIALPKAATSRPQDRPKANDHYRTLQVIHNLGNPDAILLVDDIITRGATFLGAASLIADAFPATKIYCFAAMKAISTPEDFSELIAPCVGKIKLLPNGETLRVP